MSDTHFGYQCVREEDKAAKVREVFASVAQKYDVMNDLMSLGLHRAWKTFAIAQSGARPGQRVLDVAGGTGDLALAFARAVNAGSVGAAGEPIRSASWLGPPAQQPRAVTCLRIGARFVTGGETVVDMSPMIRGYCARIDA